MVLMSLSRSRRQLILGLPLDSKAQSVKIKVIGISTVSLHRFPELPAWIYQFVPAEAQHVSGSA
jgi:hypothetical protein